MKPEGCEIDQNGGLWVGGTKEKWEAFARTASPEQRHRALLALLELLPGEFGERSRAAFKLRGYAGVAEVVAEHGVTTP